MTNREWLESLSDEELARFAEQRFTCEGCPFWRDCEILGTTCSQLHLKWLKAERRKPNEQ